MPKVPLTPEFFKDHYNTTLTPEQEKGYEAWVKKMSEQRGRDISQDEENYDMKGFFASGKAQAGNGHFTDQFKKPNHPTFSDESQYNGALGPNGEKFKGGTWGEDYYQPSKEMLQYTTDPNKLQQYMQDVEPGVQLVFPK